MEWLQWEKTHFYAGVLGIKWELLSFFFFLPAVNGYQKAFMPTKKYLGFIHIGIVMNTGSFYLDSEYFLKLLNYAFGAKCQFTKFFNKVG